MPITLNTGDLAPRGWQSSAISSASELLQGASQKEFNRSKRIIQSSFSHDFITSNNVSSSNNGLVYTLVSAWSGHHHVTLRPEDIWFAILSQLNFYINAHAEELRSFFVAHEGQKRLETIDVGTINTVNFGPIVEKMTHLIEKNVNDPELRTWIMPAFSTTTNSDRVVAAILMMGTLQKYFTYGMGLVCGIPSVTLLGEKADWELLLSKLDKISQLGTEPALFTKLLTPVVQRFVQSFDAPTDPAIIDFWNRVAHKTGGSGPYYLSGWVTSFCFWDEDGISLHSDPERPVSWEAFAGGKAGCELDDVLYHRVNTDSIPSGFASVPVTVNDNGKEYSTNVLAGSVGIQGSSSGQKLDEGRSHGGTVSFSKTEDGKTWIRREWAPTKPNEAIGSPGLDSLQPLTGWWMYEIESEEDVEEGKQSARKG